MKALLIGREPLSDLGHTYVREGDYDGVVIGSMTVAQLLGVPDERALDALAEGKPVILYTPGLPRTPGNRALGAALASRRRELKNWGVMFTEGAQRTLVTAREAQLLRQAGRQPGPGAVLTPLAREILEDK